MCIMKYTYINNAILQMRKVRYQYLSVKGKYESQSLVESKLDNLFTQKFR